jgi:hypothetical protein
VGGPHATGVFMIGGSDLPGELLKGLILNTSLAETYDCSGRSQVLSIWTLMDKTEVGSLLFRSNAISGSWSLR